MAQYDDLNVFGDELIPCSFDPLTGFYRNGCCSTGDEDHGCHTVCVVLTEDFLNFSKSRGNDLSTPRLEFGFAGLIAGERWCLCAPRWQEANLAGVAPRVVLRSTHIETLQHCTLEDLKKNSIDLI